MPHALLFLWCVEAVTGDRSVGDAGAGGLGCPQEVPDQGISLCFKLACRRAGLEDARLRLAGLNRLLC